MKRLSRATLRELPAAIQRPTFDPLRTGIVHLGLGAFQRAHRAAYLQPLLAGDPRRGVVALFDASGTVPERDRHPALIATVTRMLVALGRHGAPGTLERLRTDAPL